MSKQNNKVAQLEQELAAAVEVRKQAEQGRAAAMEALHTTDATLNDLRARLGVGDSSVMPEELARAHDEQARLELLAEGADRQLAAARQAEHQIRVEALAEALAVSSPLEVVDEAVAGAVKGLERALLGVVAAVNGRNTAIADGIREASAAGLVQGKVSPDTRVRVITRHASGQTLNPGQLEVDGERHKPSTVEDAVERALRTALKAVGVDVQVGGGER